MPDDNAAADTASKPPPLDPIQRALDNLVRRSSPLAPADLLEHQPLLNSRAVIDSVGSTVSNDAKALAAARCIREAIGQFPNQVDRLIAEAMFGIDEYGGLLVNERTTRLERIHRITPRQYSEHRQPILASAAFELRCPTSSGVLPDGSLTAGKEAETLEDLEALLETLALMEAVILIATLFIEQGAVEPWAKRLYPYHPIVRAWSYYYVRAMAFADWAFSDRYGRNNLAATSALYRPTVLTEVKAAHAALLALEHITGAARNNLYYTHFPPAEYDRPGNKARAHEDIQGGSFVVGMKLNLSAVPERLDAAYFATNALTAVVRQANPANGRWERRDLSHTLHFFSQDLVRYCHGIAPLPPTIPRTDEGEEGTLDDALEGVRNTLIFRDYRPSRP